MPFKVLLCCVEPRDPSVTINEKTLSDFFSAFGSVSLVCVFSRKPPIKAFVEFERPEDAQTALELNKTKETPFGQVYLTVSKKSQITAKPPIKSKDEMISGADSFRETTTASSRQNDSRHFNDSEKPRLRPNSENAKPSLFADSNARRPCDYRPTPLTSSRFKPELTPTSLGSFVMQSQFPVSPGYTSPSLLAGLQDPVQTRAKCAPQNKVLILHKATNPRITPRALANLFGCFGNVIKVLLNHKVKYALIEMETEIDSRNCLHWLDGQTILGAPLKVRLSHYPSLSLTSLDKSANPDFEFYVEDPDNYLYKDSERSRLAAPSSQLALFDVPEKLTKELLSLLISTITIPLSVSWQASHPLANFLVLKLESKASCFDVIADLQNVPFNDEKLRFSFLTFDV